MNWDAIGAIGEIIGAGAVVFSLVYLSIQIQRQAAESRAAAAHEIAHAFRESVAVFSNSEMADLFLKGHSDVDSLSEKEKLQLITSVQRVLRVWEEAFVMHRKGRLEADLWEPMISQYCSLLATPVIQYVWKARKSYYNNEFRSFVDSLDPTDYII